MCQNVQFCMVRTSIMFQNTEGLQKGFCFIEYIKYESNELVQDNVQMEAVHGFPLSIVFLYLPV